MKEIKDIVYVSPETFDSSKTIEIAREIGILNNALANSNYILIGPGRWGTQDRWLGMPVYWNEISNVKILVETALKDFNIKPTQGTHFFQNIISKGIGYVHVSLDSTNSFIDWEWLKKQKIITKKKYTSHIKLNKPLNIKLNGRTGEALFLKP